MKPAHIAAGAIAAAFVGGAVFLRSGKMVSETPILSPTPTPVLLSGPQCDASLWAHVYPGDPKRFKVAQDRLKVIQDCVTVTGTLVDAKAEKDGDEHVQLDLDAPFKSMLNDKNISKQKGYLVVEPTCISVPTQKDTVKEGSCDGWHNPLVIPPMGTHVAVTGVLVLDEEHLWVEVHPVTSIKAIK